MKVRKQPIDFCPITITLETKEEATTMWYILNVDTPSVVLANNRAKVNAELHREIWEMFDKVYRP